MDSVIEIRENARQLEQSLLDVATSKKVRNKLGQYATPPQLAMEIVENTWRYVSFDQNLSILEPACGTGAFISAILRANHSQEISLQAFEIDTEVEKIARQLWQEENCRISLADFTLAVPNEDDKVDLLITNPPYSRHHHIANAKKLLLRETAKAVTGIQPNGLAGLYCYFILIAHQWLKPGAVSAWLIPSEFMDVNYGKAIKDYLLQKVTLLRIHCFDSAESLFRDALVSSSVVWFRNQFSQPTESCECTSGNSFTDPDFSRQIRLSDLAKVKKWTHVFSRQHSLEIRKQSIRLADLFRVSRGVATGSNAYFILTELEIRKHNLPQEFLTPVLPSSKYVLEDFVRADEQGVPISEKRLFLLTCGLGEYEVKEKYPSLHKYLKLGEQLGLPTKYLCSRRRPWYLQESRPPAPIVFTYMGRISRQNRPFRFIRNYSLATATNVYLMLYPTPKLKKLLEFEPQLLDYIWEFLNHISFSQIKKEGRSYGGGLHKIEPRELGNLSINDARLNQIFTNMSSDSKVVQLPLFAT